MIPSVPHGTSSKAELRVFDRLKASFSGAGDRGLTAYHSLNLTRHAYKRFGEIDFLIVGEPGIFVLEIKGGGVECADGVWYYENRWGQVSHSPEGPFKQAESALHGLMDKLKAELPRSVWSGFTTGCGVIFPDCDWNVAGAEWDRPMLADARDSRNLEKWLSGHFSYWRKRERKPRTPPDHTAVREIKRFLRPEFEVAVPLHVQAREVEERVAALTADQMTMVDVADANPRVLCSGGAGTGKTFLAMELARRWTAQGLGVLLACRSPWLKRYLEANAMRPGLAVSVADAVILTARRTGVIRFDALIVDEGQDLLDMATLDRLDGVLEGGLGGGRWCFFHDVNNQSGFFGEPDRDALGYLESCGPAHVPLTTNCRNTRLILEKVQSSLRADMGVRGTGEGPKLVEQVVSSREESARVLAAEIDRIIDRGGLLPSEVTILSPQPYNRSSAALLPSEVSSHVVVLDEYSLRHFPPDGISFAPIADFKGLENEAVIVIDLAKPSPGMSPSPDHYVGMSRPRALLSLIFRR